MTRELWTNVDNYIADLFVGTNPTLDGVVRACDEAGLPAIAVSPSQGKFLQLLAKSNGSRDILEIGTLGGYSTIWLAGALPKDGRLVTLELDPKHAEVARANFARAGLDHLIELRLGKAIDSLAQLVAEKHHPFDFIFIDADKTGYSEYLKWSLKLSHRGTIIIADNVVRDGAIADPTSIDVNVLGAQCFNKLLAGETRVSSIIMQTVGSKGYDGFAIALVTS